jgi:hypothetical protein
LPKINSSRAGLSNNKKVYETLATRTKVTADPI